MVAFVVASVSHPLVCDTLESQELLVERVFVLIDQVGDNAADENDKRYCDDGSGDNGKHEQSFG
jgi:hypothetical protein